MPYVIYQNKTATGTELISIHVLITMHKIPFHLEKKKNSEVFFVFIL